MATSPFHRPPPVVPSTAAFTVGARVTYDGCGVGRVTAVSEDAVVVDFGNGDVRRLAAGTPGMSVL